MPLWDIPLWGARKAIGRLGGGGGGRNGILTGRFKTGFLWLISLHLLLMPAIVGYIFVVSKKGNR